MDGLEVEKKPQIVSRNPMLVPCFLGVDYMCMGGVIVLWFILLFTDNLPGPVRRGFWCHDRSLLMPFLEENIFTDEVLYVICFAAPLILILYGECMLSLCSCKKEASSTNAGRRKIVKSCSLKLYPVIRRMFRFSGVFTCGAFATWIITDVAQRITGCHTPYFLTVCRPNYTNLDCNVFIIEFNCSRRNDDLIEQARCSFPSLHASLGSFSAIFTTVYLTSQIHVPCARLPIPLACLMLITGGFLLGVKQGATYRHHWSDVGTGFLLGTSVAVYLVFAVLSCFDERSQEDLSKDLKKASSPSRSPLAGIRLPRLRTCDRDHLGQNGLAAYHNPSFVGDSLQGGL